MKRPSLQVRLFIGIALGVLLTAGLFSFIASFTVRQYDDRMLKERVVLSQLAASHLDEAIRTSLRQLGQTPAATLLSAVYLPTQAGQDFIDSLAETLPLSPADVALLTPKGRAVYTSPYNGALDGTDVSTNSAVSKAISSQAPVVSDLLPDISGDRAVIYMVAPLKTANGQPQGFAFAVIDLNNSNLVAAIGPVKMGETGYALVLDSNGVILASTKPVPMFTEEAHSKTFADMVRSGEATSGTCQQCHNSPSAIAGNADEMLAFAPLSSARWGVIIAQSQAEVATPLHDLQRRLILASIIVFAAALPLAWLGIRNLFSPLRTLKASSRRIAQGDLSTAVPYMGQDEIGELSNTLDEMRTKLEQSRRDLHDRIQRSTQELTALVRASRTLTSTLGTAELLNSIVATAVNTVEEADSGVLYLYDSTQGLLLPQASVGFRWESLSRAKFAPNEGVAGLVFATGKPFIRDSQTPRDFTVNTVSEYNRNALIEAMRGRPYVSLVGVPLEIKGSTIGTLVLGKFGPPAPFPPDKASFISAFAALAATIIEHHRLTLEAGQAKSLREMDRVKNEFLSNISHELRTPLTSIIISADSLLATAPAGQKDNPRVRLLQNIRRNSERLNRLVGEILDISRLQTGAIKLNPEPVLLSDAIRESMDTVRPMAEAKQLNLTSTSSDEMVLVNADRGRLVQTLINLLANAVNFTPPGGSVSVTVSVDGDYASIHVSDTGIGVHEDERQRIFERFYRSSRVKTKSGMGLGLPIAKALVELHGGTLSVRSNHGQGSVFT
ncbi:MAG: ATP-binding protein, partial [Dehalococcoidia bacterium]|nr:ATP-binding protein [Dehalococcoidia bacterium]